jgi:Protein of unknown function (DUF1236)
VGREAILGAIAESALPPEPPVVYSGAVVLGEQLPEGVMAYPVPQYDEYSYTLIGPRRIIIDRKTRRIVRVIE